MNEKLTIHKDVIGFCLIGLFIFFFLFSHVIPSLSQTLIGSETIVSIFSIFLSILIKGIPFVLVGALYTALLSTMITQKKIVHAMTQLPFLGWLLLLLNVGSRSAPISSRFITKKIPVYLEVIILFVTPLFNPIVWISTFVAFSNTPEMVSLRVGIIMLLSLFLGAMVYLLFQNKNISHTFSDETTFKQEKWLHAFSEEFFQIGKYFLIGAAFVSVIQTVMQQELVELGTNEMLSTILLMLLSFVLSVHPTADSFIAATFQGILPTSSILAFLLFGAMFNVRNMAVFCRLFSIRLIVCIGTCLFIGVLCVVLLV
ncbi:hypothetical protein FZW96_03545 [Bacillus sp. BGMRC 2118]|nr:hypothetical protein FZW96_03545 [Bacillus sp. BGMRC 2118]